MGHSALYFGMNRSLAIGISMLVTALAAGILISKTKEERRPPIEIGKPLIGERPSMPTPDQFLDEESKRGKMMFNQHCLRCHSSRLEEDLVGPALFGVSARVPSREWLVQYIQNAHLVEAEGDQYAIALKAKWKSTMPTTPIASEDAKAIIQYIENYVPEIQ